MKTVRILPLFALVLSIGCFLSLSGCSTTDIEPATLEYRAQKALEDLDFYTDHAPTPYIPLTEEMAIEYALTYNIDLWIAREQIAIQNEIKNSTYLKMLPNLMLKSEQSRRNKYDISNSVDEDTGIETLSNSYSEEKKTQTYEVSAVWNLLDFGLTYVKSRQEHNRQMITENIYRRTRQKMILDVKGAYWGAVTSAEAAKVANSIGSIIEKQRETLRRQIEEGNISKEAGLEQDLKLLNRQKMMKRYDRDAQVAKAQLTRLIGLPVGTQFEFEKVDFSELGFADTDLPDLKKLEQYALMNRPELYNKDLDEAISLDDANAALLKMLPSPSFFWRYEHDEDDQLKYHDWTTVGFTATWNLLSIPSRYYEHKAGVKQAEVHQHERMAMAVGILTQLNIAAIQYREAVKALAMTSEITTKRTVLLDAVIEGRKKGTRHTGEVLDQKLLFLQDRTAFLMAFANAAMAKARIYNTLGIDINGNGDAIIDSLKTAEEILAEYEERDNEIAEIQPSDVVEEQILTEIQSGDEE